MELPEELIDFRNWCQKNAIQKNFEILDMLLMHYKKSIDCALDETQAVRQNEQTKEVCSYCNGSELDPNNKTLYYKPCPRCC